MSLASLPMTPAKRRRIRRDYAEFLPGVQAVLEKETSPTARLLVLTLAGLVAAVLAWAAFGTLERVASAPGEIRPAMDVVTVNHPEGGRAARIYVREGEQVAAGQTLLRLDPGLLREEVGKLAARRDLLAAQVARLEGEADGRVLTAAGGDLTLDGQRALAGARRDALAAERAGADSAVAQRQGELRALERRIAQLERSLAISVQQRDAVAELAEKGYFPKLKFLSLEREVSDLRGELAQARETRAAAESALAEAREARAAIDRDFRVDVLQELTEARSELQAVSKQLAQAELRLAGLEVTAPIAGTVERVYVTGAGQSAAPNEPLVALVPYGEELLVEARVADADRGAVQPGQPVRIKVKAYDFVRYGTLEGEVARVAADASRDEDSGEIYFKAEVAITDTAGLALQPGLQTEVDFQLGRQSILGYFTDRLTSKLESALTEK